jgi:hypothetical protein
MNKQSKAAILCEAYSDFTADLEVKAFLEVCRVLSELNVTHEMLVLTVALLTCEDDSMDEWYAFAFDLQVAGSNKIKYSCEDFRDMVLSVVTPVLLHI